ncbi:MAG TPA: sigma-70 factor domain-containing protein, partial [Rubrobacteraceae bacterium]|nr:sigma-70 factor domain-containing protein [Rubrobacteraceae bacterium]
MAQQVSDRQLVGKTRKETAAETPELLAKYLNHIGQGKLLTYQEEIDLSKKAKSGDK